MDANNFKNLNLWNRFNKIQKVPNYKNHSKYTPGYDQGPTEWEIRLIWRIISTDPKTMREQLADRMADKQLTLFLTA